MPLMHFYICSYWSVVPRNILAQQHYHIISCKIPFTNEDTF